MVDRTWWQGLYFVGKHGQLRHGFWKAWTENLKMSIIMMRSSKKVNWRVFQLIVPSWWPCWRSLHGCQFGSFLDGTRPAGCIIESFDFTSKKKVHEQSIQGPGEKQQSQNSKQKLISKLYLIIHLSNPQCLFLMPAFQHLAAHHKFSGMPKPKMLGVPNARKQASTYTKDMTKNHVSESRTCFWSFLAPQNNAKVRCF